MLKYDVIVIGSSPADALAALELAKNNKNDKATLPHNETCGSVWFTEVKNCSILILIQ